VTSSKRLPWTVLAVATAFLLVMAAPAAAHRKKDRHHGHVARANAHAYQVTIRNLTRGQPLTPPVIVTHSDEDQVFEVGDPASVGVREIAENGNAAPLLAFLNADPFGQFFDIESSNAPIVPPGRVAATGFSDEQTLTIDAVKGFRHLSWVSMLICTNDGFTGLNGLELPKKIGRSVTVTTNGYDAHTERNTEDFADIVPPCQGLVGVSSGEPGTGVSNPALAEGGVIAHHDGIKGGADLSPSVHGWTDPVAEVTVRAIG
jgi:Spondin_N